MLAGAIDAGCAASPPRRAAGPGPGPRARYPPNRRLLDHLAREHEHLFTHTASAPGTTSLGSAGLRRIAITMARSSGNALFTNFSTYDAPFPTKVRLALANGWKKARTRSGCCGNYGQPGC